MIAATCKPHDFDRAKEITVRRILTALFALAVLAAVSAQPAAVVTGITYTDLSDADTLARSCSTPYQVGVLGNGAWGYFISGCSTGKLRCPTGIRKCQLRATSMIGTGATLNHQVTLNQRVTVVSPEGSRSWHDDRSCANRNSCRANFGGYQENVDCWYGCVGFVYINPSETAEATCNGVREQHWMANTAAVQCKLYVDSIF
jgi:hypothetical protein